MKENRLGGIMFWSVDSDDFRGICNGKQYPLIEAGKLAMFSSTSTKDNTNEVTVTNRVKNVPPSSTR